MDTDNLDTIEAKAFVPARDMDASLGEPHAIAFDKFMDRLRSTKTVEY
jgi:hypothetical protein